MRSTLSVTLIVSALLLGACDQEQAAPPDAAGPAADEAHEGHADASAKAEGEGSEEESCGGETSQLTDDRQTTRVGEDGREIVHVGQGFTDASLVTVGDLKADPDSFAGKVVQVKGPISAMCTHKRGWFAIAAADQSGEQLRVLTAPVFLVPEGSIGKDAVAEGTVEVIEVGEQAARHLQEGHNIGEEAEVQGPTKQVVIRATGADFI